MLISFSVTNYLSFRDKQSLSFAPGPLKEHKDYLHIPYLYDIEERLLKSVALYGHNSHGKSNFLKGYDFFRSLIFSSFTLDKKTDGISVESFRLNTISEHQTTDFDISFYVRNKKYKYECKFTNSKVFQEILSYSEPKLREITLFARQEQDIRISKVWNKDSNNKVEQAIFFAKPHILLLSVLFASDGIPHVEEIETWFKSNIILLDINAIHQDEQLKHTVAILTNPKYRLLINKFISQADLGFVTIEEKVEDLVKKKLEYKEILELYYADEIENFELFTKHEVYNEKLQHVKTILFELLKSESSGTVKYLILVCYLTYAIKEGRLILIDELDSRFHSLLLKVIIELYNSSKINTMGSQMIFTTHNTILLNEVLRRDQIIFVEKDKYGASSVKRLHTSNTPIRKGTSIEKEYLRGKHGGISEKLKLLPEQGKLDF